MKESKGSFGDIHESILFSTWKLQNEVIVWTDMTWSCPWTKVCGWVEDGTKIYGKSGIVPEWRARKKLNLDRKKGRKIEIRVETEKVGGQQTGHALPWGRPLHGLEDDHLYMRIVMWPWSLLNSPRQEVLSDRPLLLSQTLQWMSLDPGAASTSKFPTPDQEGAGLHWYET